MNDMQALQKCILFDGKTAHDINSLLSSVSYTVRTFDRGEIVFSPDKRSDTLGIVLSGSLEIQKFFPSGKIVIIAQKNSSSLLGEAAVFSKWDYYPSTVSAKESSRIMLIHKDELIRLFSTDSGIMLNFLRSVSDSMLVLKHKIGLLSLNSIREKIAGFLFSECRNANCRFIRLPFSKRAWAEHLNVSRTSLSRELKLMEAEGILSFDKRLIKIEDPEKLNEILSL